MILNELVVILRRNNHGKIVAIAEQETPEGKVHGTNLIKQHRAKNFAQARTLVELALNGSVRNLIFKEESTEWER